MELERKTGIAKSSLQRYVSGSTKKIPIDAIDSIAFATNTSSAWIMGWTEKQNGQSIDDDKLSEADKKILELFHKVPLDKREAVIQMIEVALKMQI